MHSDDQALVILGLVMVVGILLGIAWIFFNPLVDLAILAVVTVGVVWWRLRQAG